MAEAIEVKVLRMAAGGDAVAKADGSDRVVFVPYGTPGDLLSVEIVEKQPRYHRARILKVLEPGPARVEPACKVHFRPGAKSFCGGCDWQQLAYRAQLESKREIVREALKRVGGLEIDVPPLIASPEPLRYRNKVQIPFQASPSGLTAGFYRPGSHEIVPFDDCVVQPELSVRILNFVKEMAKRRKWPGYMEDRRIGWLRALFVRTSREGKAMLALVTRNDRFPDKTEAVAELREAFPELVGIHHNIQPRRTNVIFGTKWHRLWGKGRLREKVGHIELAVSPPAFLQVNTPASELLYDKAKAFLTEGGFEPVVLWDLYSGIGSIALYLAHRAKYVLGLELNRRAVEDAVMNAKINEAPNVRFVGGKAEFMIHRIEVKQKAPWAAVLDPPRTGCEPGVLKHLVKKEFQRVICISCDPASFARDAGRLKELGWKLDRLQPVDLFPQTHHVEICARFTRA